MLKGTMQEFLPLFIYKQRDMFCDTTLFRLQYAKWALVEKNFLMMMKNTRKELTYQNKFIYPENI